MGKYFEIIDDIGNVNTYEIVSTFKLDGYTDNNYIIYRDLGHDHYYLAKYKEMNFSSLNANLTREEYRLSNEFFKNEVIING